MSNTNLRKMIANETAKKAHGNLTVKRVENEGTYNQSYPIIWFTKPLPWPRS